MKLKLKLQLKQNTLADRVSGEDGFVLVISLVLLLILVVLGTSATRTTTIEYHVATNDRFIKEDFYNQESCKTTGILDFRQWLTTNYLVAGENSAFFPPAGGTDANSNGINDAAECISNGVVVGSFKVRNIEATGSDINTWEDAASFTDPTKKHPANDFPPLPHQSKPMPGSGYDPTNFKIRRFVVTSYSADPTRQVVLQEGASKVFNNF